MTDISTEQFAHRIEQCRLIETREIDKVFSGLGGRDDVQLEDFIRALIQKELLTNWQVERLREGHKSGYFYGNWKVLYLVGAGTFARVYRAVHIKSGDVKAVKVLRKRYVDDELTRERFEREAKTVIKLRHPNIVPIHEVETHRGRLYMVMDFIEGQNLRDFVRAHGKVKLMTALKIIRDLSSGLHYAFQLGICHRDMKLSNVLLSSSGRASLVDFGLAGIEEETKANIFHPRSVDYAGLEKATRVNRDDKRSDLFFLGCILYQMLCGKPPLFETRERMRRMSIERYRDVEPITNLMPELPNRVVLLVNHLMELEPLKRCQTPGAALSEANTVIEAIESGDYRKFDKRLTEKEAYKFSLKMQKKNEGQNHTVMVVESNPKVQDALRKRLKAVGYRVLILSDPNRALERFEDLDAAEDLPADCVLFGCAGLGRAGLEAFNSFAEGEASAELPAILMMTEDQTDFLKDANLKRHHASVPLPIKFPVIRKILRKLLNIPDPKVISKASKPLKTSDSSTLAAD